MECGAIVGALSHARDEVGDVIGGSVGKEIEDDGAIGRVKHRLLVLQFGWWERGREKGLSLNQSEQHKRDEHAGNYRAAPRDWKGASGVPCKTSSLPCP